MPSTITDVVQWETTVAEPNNGENADAASLHQFNQKFSNRTAYLYEHHFRGNFQAEKYGAVGSGLVNDYPAIATAVAAAAAAGGGTVWAMPGKSYRLDSELVLPGTVSLRTAKGRVGVQDTRLIRNHSGRLIRLNATSPTPFTPTVIEGLKFIDAAASSQAMIDVQDGSLTLHRCWLQGLVGLTGGPLLLMRGGEGDVCRLRECSINPDLDGNGLINEIGLLDVQGNVLTFPTQYSGNMIALDSTSSFDPASLIVVGNDFFAKNVGTGTPTAIRLDGLYWRAAVQANHFRGSASNPLQAFAWGSGGTRVLVERGNNFSQCVGYVPAGLPLTFDSSLDLGTWRDATGGTSYPLPSGYRNMVLVSTGSAGIDVQFPPGLFEGQELTFTLVNNHGSSTIAMTVSGTPLTGPALPGSIGAGNTLTGVFVWEKANGTGIYAAGRWIQKGTWGVGTTLVA